MTSTTTSPSIDQGAKLMFMDNFYSLAQQTKSKLVNSGVATFLPAEGKTHNLSRMGRIELSEVVSRNPDKQIGDYAIDNRMFTKRRFTKTIQIDQKFDINELLKDPTSDLIMQLNAAKERVIDRIITSVAGGNVLIGRPDRAPSTLSAASDGVITVNALAGVTYDTVKAFTQNFINNDLQYEDFRGSVICYTGKENSALMSETKFINQDYISTRPVESGILEKAGTYTTKLFAGSESGGITVSDPILEENSGTGHRTCLVLAPNAVSLAMKVDVLGVEKSATKVNSWDITIDLWINGMRNEGVRVQKFETTI